MKKQKIARFKTINITVDKELIERCDKLRLTGRFKHWSLKRFCEMILETGMDKYELMFPLREVPVSQEEVEYEILREKTTLQVADCETVPALPPTTAKIIPFPGVSLKEAAGDIQDTLDGFLREIGYIE